MGMCGSLCGFWGFLQNALSLQNQKVLPEDLALKEFFKAQYLKMSVSLGQLVRQGSAWWFFFFFSFCVDCK